jgi:DNA-binding transcriptional MerR regulator
MKTYSTSEFARLVNLHPNTVMLYEKWGYIAPVPRKANGYRNYSSRHLDQIKFARIALKNNLIKIEIRKKVSKIIKTVALGDLTEALSLCEEYKSHIQQEKQSEEEVLNLINEILKNENEETKLVNRNEAAKIVGVSKNVVINWERYGFIDVPRNEKNGYRVYSGKELKLLKCIKTLRNYNYSMSSISRMAIKLLTINNNDNKLLSALSEAENDADEMIAYIKEIVSGGKSNE